MREDQADQIIEYLKAIFVEISELRQEFNEFTNHGAQNMTESVKDITGPTRYSLEDLHGELVSIGNFLASIDGKT
jgi:hypothetical protein